MTLSALLNKLTDIGCNRREAFGVPGFHLVVSHQMHPLGQHCAYQAEL